MDSNNIYKEYNAFFLTAKERAKKFFSYNQYLLENYADLSLYDIEQECFMAVFKTLNKYINTAVEQSENSKVVKIRKTNLDLAKLTSQCVTWILQDLQKNAWKCYKTKKAQVHLLDKKAETNDNADHVDYASLVRETIKDVNKESFFSFQELRSILTKREFFVLTEIVINKFKVPEVAGKLKLPINKTRAIYFKALKKSKKYLFNGDKHGKKKERSCGRDNKKRSEYCEACGRNH